MCILSQKQAGRAWQRDIDRLPMKLFAPQIAQRRARNVLQ